MLRKTGFGIALIVALTLAAGVVADEVTTLEGKIACAKCTLKFEGAADCQSVLVVQKEGSTEPAYYYLVKNSVTEEYGHVCMGEKGAVVTGTIAEKEGRLWLTASKMEEPEES